MYFWFYFWFAFSIVYEPLLEKYSSRCFFSYRSSFITPAFCFPDVTGSYYSRRVQRTLYNTSIRVEGARARTVKFLAQKPKTTKKKNMCNHFADDYCKYELSDNLFSHSTQGTCKLYIFHFTLYMDSSQSCSLAVCCCSPGFPPCRDSWKIRPSHSPFSPCCRHTG